MRKIVLEGDRGERLVLFWMATFSFASTACAGVRPAPSLHQPAGELVDDDHLVVLHHVMLVAMEQVMRAQRRIQLVHQVDIRRLVQARALRQHADARQDLLGLLMPALRRAGSGGSSRLRRNRRAPRLPLLSLFLLAREKRGDLVHAVVDLGAVLSLAEMIERRARLVDSGSNRPRHDGVNAICANNMAMHVDERFQARTAFTPSLTRSIRS